MNKFLIFMLICGIAGCSLYRIDSELISEKVYAPKSSEDEVKYLETVSRANEVIGYAKVNAERNQRMEEVLKKLKYEAAMLGGDAITNIRTNAGDGRWARVKPKELFGNSHVRANFIADVIVFK